MTTTILLFGSSGFAGAHFEQAARAAGHEVVQGSRRAATGAIAVDLLNPASLERAISRAKPDAIVNLAGAASVGESWRDPAAAFELNALGALHLLEATARHTPEAHLLFASSGEVYGAATEDELPFTEGGAIAPLSPYAASKAAMEVVCGQYARSAGLSITVARAFNHLGPGQSDRFAASTFAHQIAAAEVAGQPAVELRVGDLSPARDFTDVRDVAAAYLLAVERRLVGTYNICSGQPTPLRSLVENLEAHTQLTVRISVEEARKRPKEPAVLFGSYARFGSATGWKPSIPLDRSLADLLDWWRGELRR